MHITLELTQRRPRRLTLGIAVSVLVHAVLLFVYRIDSMRAPEFHEPAPESLFVLVKPQPRPEPVAAIPSPRKSIAAPSAPAKAAKEQEAVEPISPPVMTVDRSEVPDPFYTSAPTEKPFDVEAARAAARQIATTPDPARADLPVAQFDKERNRITSVTKLERDISKAERPDCKDGIPGLFGGILSPLNLLTDKKDHGCKW